MIRILLMVSNYLRVDQRLLDSENGCDTSLRELIDASQAVVIFLTKQYEAKVNMTFGSNMCKTEFFITIENAKRKILPIVIDFEMRMKPWVGHFGVVLNHMHSFDFSDVPFESSAFDQRMDELNEIILNLIGRELRISSDFHEVHVDGGEKIASNILSTLIKNEVLDTRPLNHHLTDSPFAHKGNPAADHAVPSVVEANPQFVSNEVRRPTLSPNTICRTELLEFPDTRSPTNCPLKPCSLDDINAALRVALMATSNFENKLSALDMFPRFPVSSGTDSGPANPSHTHALLGKVVGQLAEVLRKNMYSELISEKAFAAVCVLCDYAQPTVSSGNSSIIRVCGEAGVDELAITALRMHLKVKAVAQSGCETICRLMSTGESLDRLSRTALLDVALSVCKVYCDSPHLLVCGCRILGYFSASESVDWSKYHNVIFETLLRIMRTHADHKEVTLAVCRALHNFAWSSNVARGRLGKTAVCDALLASVCKHVDSEEVIRAALDVARGLSQSNASNTMKLLTTGFSRALCDILSADRSTGLYILVSQTISCLCSTDSAVTIFLDDGIYRASLSLLKDKSTACEVAEVVAKQLLKMASVSGADNRRRLSGESFGDCLLYIAGDDRLTEETKADAYANLHDFISVDSLAHILREAHACKSNLAQCERALMLVTSLSDSGPDQVRALGVKGDVTVYIVELLRWHVLQVEVCRRGLAAMSVLSRCGPTIAGSCDETIELFVGCGACTVVCSALQAHVQDAGVARNGSAVIRNLSINARNVVELGEQGACRAITRAISTHANVNDIVELGSNAIVNLATSSCNYDKLREAGACEQMVASLTAHIDDAAVTEKCLAAVANLAIDNICEVHLARAGACEAVIHAISRHCSTVGVVVQGCWAMANLSASLGKRLLLGKAGPCEAELAKVLQAHASITAVVEPGCWALHNLVIANEQYKDRVLATGVISTLVDVSVDASLSYEARHRAVEVFQQLWTIDDVVSLLEDAARELDQRSVAQEVLNRVWVFIEGNRNNQIGLTRCRNFVSIAVEVLAKFHHSEHVVRRVLLILQVLCQGGSSLSCCQYSFADTFSAAGVVDVVVDVLCAQLESQELTTSALQTLSLFLKSSYSSKWTADCPRTCRAVTAALQAFRTDPSSCEAALRVLRPLSQREDGVRALVEAYLSPTLLEVLGLHRVHTTIVGLSLELVTAMCTDPDSLPHLVSLRACELVTSVLEDHPQSTSIAESGLWAISSLCLDADNTNEALLGQTGACFSAVSLLRTHLSVPAVVEAALSAISNLATSAANEAVFAGAEGLGPLLSYALSMYYSAPRITELALGAICNLASVMDHCGGWTDSTCYLVVNCFTAHLQDAAVVEEAFGVLAVFRPTACSFALNSAVIGLLVRALELHRHHAGVVEAGCTALKVLVTLRKIEKYDLISLEIQKCLREFVTDFELDEGARWQAMELLGVLGLTVTGS